MITIKFYDLPYLACPYDPRIHESEEECDRANTEREEQYRRGELAIVARITDVNACKELVLMSPVTTRGKAIEWLCDKVAECLKAYMKGDR